MIINKEDSQINLTIISMSSFCYAHCMKSMPSCLMLYFTCLVHVFVMVQLHWKPVMSCDRTKFLQ